MILKVFFNFETIRNQHWDYIYQTNVEKKILRNGEMKNGGMNRWKNKKLKKRNKKLWTAFYSFKVLKDSESLKIRIPDCKITKCKTIQNFFTYL